MRPFLALYAGGMGARGANFHFEVFARMGYEDVATKVQELYLDGRKDEAAAAIPLAMVEDVALVGPPEKIREELAPGGTRASRRSSSADRLARNTLRLILGFGYADKLLSASLTDSPPPLSWLTCFPAGDQALSAARTVSPLLAADERPHHELLDGADMMTMSRASDQFST